MLSATMAVSVIGTVLPAFALEDDGLEVSAFQTSSRYDLGIDADNVRIGWEIDAENRGMVQSEYHVIVKDSKDTIVWDSGWVTSDQQTGIRPQGLKPETVYTYQVNIKDQSGTESGWSDPKTIETAPAKVDGQWIASDSLLRKTFELDQPLENIDRARSYIGSTSYMELRMNGNKVGDMVLAPKKPVADLECYYNTYDILPYLQDGKNTIGVMVSGVNSLGDRAAGMIKIYYKDGTTQTISTDTNWRASAKSEITRENLSTGEDVNANLRDSWDTNDYVEDETWSNALPAGPTIVDGQLRIPSNSGIYYSKQSFSGDYTIHATVTPRQNAYGLVFGHGNPNPGMWQFNVEGTGVLRAHHPGQWTTVDTIPCDDIKKDVPIDVAVTIQGTTVTTSVNGNTIHTTTVGEGETTGPIGMRAALNESFDLDKMWVEQNGEVIFEDNFDTVDYEKWNFPSSPDLVPSISGTKVIDEIKPISVHESTSVDKTRPYAEDGALVLPTNCGTFYSNQSFSGDYTVEVAAKTNSVFGFLFGSGNPNPCMWQIKPDNNGALYLHRPGDWTDIKGIFGTPGVDPINDWVHMKIEVKGNHVATYIGDILVDEVDLPEGSTTGPLGFRTTIDESSTVDYVRVTQNGQVVFEDNFDKIDSSKWAGFIEPTTNYVLDYGKNMQGYVKVDTTGPKGSTISVKYAELLNEDGSINGTSTFHHPYCSYTLSGGEDSFEPRFFYTGFRYVAVEGVQGEFDPNDFTACFVSDDVTQTGYFDSSNDRLDQVFDMYYQSQRSNMMSNYTDCPQREKNGWTGNASVIKESAAMMLDDYTTAEAFMKTMYLDITEEGQPFTVVPWVSTDIATNAGFDITWTSAYFVFPYQTYMQTGDLYYLEMAYEPLTRVFDYYKSLDKDGDYIVTDNVYGDWLGYDNQEGKIDRGFLTAPYFYYCGCLLAEMADVIGEDHTELDAYLDNVYQALQNTYNKETYFSTETQTANAMALDFEIVPPENKEAVVQTLVNAVTNANTTIKTGVLGTKSIYSALGEANQHKTLLDMTITPEKCSFGYMIDNGATTLWEYWDKFGETFNSNLTPNDVGAYDSQNHAMMGGGPATWMFKGLGGITETEAGYEEITYRPGVESELEYVDSSIDTIRGLAESNWDIVDGDLIWDVTVPANSTATIKIPMKDAKTITESGNDIFQKDGNGITYVGQEENGDYVYTVGSGSYHFVASEQESIVETDKDILNKIIAYAENAADSDEFDNVITDVQESFQAALNAAKEVAGNDAATQEEVDAAWQTLLNEIHKLGFVKGDITSLEDLVVLAESYDMDDYVEAGQAEFLEALKAAQDLLMDKDNAMAEEIETAESNLLNAMLNLRYKADKSILEKVIAEANEVNSNAYTVESYAVLEAAVAEANAVMANEDATQEEVNAAVTSVQEAMKGLVAVEKPSTETPDDNKADSTQTGQESTTTKANAAKTGDFAPIAGAAAMAVVAGAVLLISRKKK
ncbi:family 78 glycoside hydrolase catalytic domain [Massilioclostridium coli]|uniref:family 78 glycoside hydrolase catalytic domain n=1 Tax=Massilioclostridium coli TaxID=1870991 RepID=UPI0022DF9A04|nr:family 78 glycoside hydrolase catalytic domain [Massilioclostridium coli]